MNLGKQCVAALQGVGLPIVAGCFIFIRGCNIDGALWLTFPFVKPYLGL